MASFGSDFNAAYGLSFHPSHFEENPIMTQSPQQQQKAPSNFLDPRSPIPPVTREPVKQTPPYDGEYLMQQVKNDEDMVTLQRELKRYQNANNGSGYYPQQPSFFDTMWAKRKDVMKLVTLSLIILLGISLHSTIDHFFKKWLLEADLSERNEMLARMAYPLSVLLIIWMIKTGK